MSGHMRGYDKNISEANKMLVEMADRVFISTWEESGDNSVFWRNNERKSSLIDKESMLSIYNPTNFDIENSKDYETSLLKDYTNVSFRKTKQFVSVKNAIIMFKKIKKSLSYVTDEDIVIRGRPDVTDVPGFNLNKKLEDGVIYGRITPWSKIPSEVFFYGTKNSMVDFIPDEDFFTEELINTTENAEEVFYKAILHRGMRFEENKEMKFLLRGKPW